MLKRKYNGFLILLVAELIFILALLPGCFGKEEKVAAFLNEDICKMAVQSEGHMQFCSQTTLIPGVYQVRIWTDMAQGQSLYVWMRDDSAAFKALRNNGVLIDSGNDYMEFEVYVLGRLQGAYVQCDFSGDVLDGLVRLEVWKTSMGSRMLLVIALFCFVVLDFMVVFRQRILEGKVTRRQQTVFWVLFGSVLLAIFPYMTDYFSFGDDLGFHLARIAYLADALQQGASFPVRAEGTWLCGHGYISSLFYSDFFLFVPALLRLAGFSIMTVYKTFVVLVTAITAVIAYHCFYRCVKDEYAALFGSMFYLLGPYRLFNVYYRMAVGEYLAMAFLPLVCCGMYLLYTEDVTSKEYKKYKWYVAWGMSAILQSHMISTEMTTIYMALFCVAFWKKTFRKQTFCQLLQAVGIVLVVNAWFWLPLLYMMNCDVYLIHSLTETDMQLSGISFANFFSWLPHHRYQYGVRNDVWVGAGAVMLLGFYGIWRARRKRRNVVCGVLAVFGIAALVMSTTYFPWNAIMKIPVIGYIASSLQLPWRWMSPGALFLSLLAAILFRQVREEGGVAAKTAMGIMVAVVLVSAVFHVNSIAFEAAPVYLYNEENMGTLSAANSEYLLPEMDISQVHYHKPLAEEGLVWSGYEKEGTNITITLDNQTGETRFLALPLTGYKGYGVKALEDGRSLPFVSEKRGPHGDLRLEVPAGYRGTIQISYEGFALFHVAEAVSLAGLAVIVGYTLFQNQSKRKLAGRNEYGEKA